MGSCVCKQKGERKGPVAIGEREGGRLVKTAIVCPTNVDPLVSRFLLSPYPANRNNCRGVQQCS